MTKGIGITRKQYEILGIVPKKGWIQEIIGKEITEEAARNFENCKGGKKTAHAEKIPPQGLSIGKIYDADEIMRYASALPFCDFKHTLIYFHGTQGTCCNSCAICGENVSPEKNIQNRNYLSLCNACYLKITQKNIGNMV